MKNMLKKKKKINRIRMEENERNSFFINNRFVNLEKKIGLDFNNKDLLIQAFIHHSFINENKNFYLPHNERLEFLGDAVIELIVTDYLYQKYPDKAEGILTAWRASLVNSQMLSSRLHKIGLSKFILLSQGEQKDIIERKSVKESILSNVFEALVGAIYLDQGYLACKNFLERFLLTELSKVIQNGNFKDAKSKLQEYTQKEINITPVYRTLKEQGLDHVKTFEVGVFLNEKLAAKGKGSSKQKAELQAAKKALKKMNKE